MSLPRWYTCSMPKNGRRPQSLKKVPFKEEWPMVLKNYVSTRKGKSKEAVCLKETLAFITCLKDNNNASEMCVQQAESVQSCYSNYLHQREERFKRKKSAGDFVPEINVKDMDPKQLNKFLSHFPHTFKK